ncbi:MAG: hypothetical protein HFH91_15745 [Lachnospiraceae bacterium]|nr:hypothetical protein [Lachnospiraceae bacterium]
MFQGEPTFICGIPARIWERNRCGRFRGIQEPGGGTGTHGTFGKSHLDAGEGRAHAPNEEVRAETCFRILRLRA